MPNTVRFDDICLITADVRVIATFYEQLFGVKSEGDDSYRVIFLDGLNIVFDDVEAVQQMPVFAYLHAQSSRNMLLNFNVKDVDAQYMRMRSLGIETINVPTTTVGEQSLFN